MKICIYCKELFFPAKKYPKQRYCSKKCNDKQYQETHKESVRENNKRCYKTHKKERKEYRDTHKEQRNKNKRERLKRDKKFRLHQLFGTAIWYALKKKDISKNGYSWEKILGYTTQDLIEHLEKQFRDGMNWNNHGKWHVDHIKPKSSFIFTSYEDDGFQECWALENLQPLWAEENMKKRVNY